MRIVHSASRLIVLWTIFLLPKNVYLERNLIICPSGWFWTTMVDHMLSYLSPMLIFGYCYI